MEKVIRTLCYFYNHWIKGIFTWLGLTLAYGGLLVLKTNFLWIQIIYIVASSYILSSLEIKCVNVISDSLNSLFSKLRNKYRMRSWEKPNLNNVARFYKIGWTDDYLSDLLKYFDKKKILPTKCQIDFYLKENGSSGTINTISLYELLVSQMLCLSKKELLTIKHYIESKQIPYYPKLSILNTFKSVLSTILPLYTSKRITSITIGIATFNNISNQYLKRVLSKIPSFILMSGVILIPIFISLIASLSLYNSKHRRIITVIHQALADSYSIKSKQ